MKAWRKHNAVQTVKIRELEEELSWYIANQLTTQPEAVKLQQKIKEHKSFYLRTKTERRGQFAAEVSSPSQLFYFMMYIAGLPTPVEFKSFLASMIQAKQAKQQQAKQSM